MKLLALILLLLFVSQSSVFALSSVSIKSFLPNPTNEDDEWIELQNNTSENIDISDYQLDDEANAGSKPFKIPAGTSISPQSSLKFTKTQTNIALNNSKQKDQPFADMVNLIDKTGATIDSISYTNTQTDVPILHEAPPTSVPTQVPSDTPKPTSVESNTPKPTKSPAPTLVPSAPNSPTVLSVSSEITSTPIPPKLNNSTGQSPSGIISIVVGLAFVGASIYFARYT